MILVETKISEKTVHMRYANDADHVYADQWIDFQVPLASLVHPSEREAKAPLGNPDLQFLSEIRRAALHCARDAITAEIQRLANLDGQSGR
jgi:hypothetical protein